MAVAAGCLLGLVASVSDSLSSGLPPQPVAWRVISIVTNAGSVWAAVAVLAGALVVSRGGSAWAAVGGAVALVAAVTGYYGAGLSVGDRADVGLTGITGVLSLWLVVALVVGPVLGVIGGLTRRRGWPGLISRLVVPVGVATEVVVRFRPSAQEFEFDPVRAWTILLMALVAVGAAVTAPAGFWVRRSTP